MGDIEEKTEKIWNQTGDQKRGRGEGRGTEGERGTGALSGGQRRSLFFLPEVLSRQLLTHVARVASNQSPVLRRPDASRVRGNLLLSRGGTGLMDS